MRPNLITRLKEEWNNLDPVDPLRGLIADAIDALAEAQPSKPWVGLTDEEIIEVIHPLVMADMADEATDYEIARAIEAKLREKNAQPSKPLTDEQIMEMYNEPRSDAEMLEFARAIEAAHGIKGEA